MKRLDVLDSVYPRDSGSLSWIDIRHDIVNDRRIPACHR